jgi:acyl carrier protein
MKRTKTLPINPPAPLGVASGALLGRIVDIITSYTGQNPDEVTRETKLREMGMDSLDMVEILMDAEDEWQCEISDEAAENLVTIGDAEKLIMQLRPNVES